MTLKEFAVIFLVIAALIGGGVWVASLENKMAYQQGQQAAQLGIRAEANPYMGDAKGGAWLEGWMSVSK